MERRVNVAQAVQLFDQLNVDFQDLHDQHCEDPEIYESDESDDEVCDPSFVLELDKDSDKFSDEDSDKFSDEDSDKFSDKDSDELVHQSTSTSAPASRKRKRARTKWSRSTVAENHLSSEPWKTEEDADSAPALSRFQPRRTPGVQVNTDSPHTPKDLFLLFFSTKTVKKICRNTNKNAAKNIAMGKKYPWTDVEMDDLHKFFGLLIYMSIVSLPSIQDYWKQNHVLSVHFPAKVMTRERFRSIFWNIYLCDPDENLKNESKKGTAGYDKLFIVRPVYSDIVTACQAYYHPRRELSVDERMVATKAKTGMTQYMKDKPTKWGLKLFVLAESTSGYTINFTIYSGKRGNASEHGLSYDTVMDLVRPSFLGTGYHVYMDNFYTSPKLFLDLASMKLGACGTYRENRQGVPKGRPNALTMKSARGSVRWIREDPLLFVKWMDAREVSICSTIHPADSDETVQRRVKDEDGCWVVREIPCPTPIMAYNNYMGGVDLSDQLIQYYSAHRKTACWYRTVLLHFLDIVTTNCWLIHRELSKGVDVRPMTHKDFMLELMCQLCDMEITGVPRSRVTAHVPVTIHTGVTDPKLKATKGRLQCRRCCQVDKTRKDTPWKCKACDVALCVVADRNCFEAWHA